MSAPVASSRVCDTSTLVSAIPVEEVTFTNPSVADATDHRSTRLEFLADCSTYGV